MILVKKFRIFPFLFFGENEPRNMFHDVLDKKETILQEKITTFQKAKTDIFTKGVGNT